MISRPLDHGADSADDLDRANQKLMEPAGNTADFFLDPSLDPNSSILG
jgi:hypothetical protein